MRGMAALLPPALHVDVGGGDGTQYRAKSPEDVIPRGLPNCSKLAPVSRAPGRRVVVVMQGQARLEEEPLVREKKQGPVVSTLAYRLLFPGLERQVTVSARAG
jgi:hypothetical protein